MAASNLRITFNFPKSNTLDVNNKIITDGANEIFRESLERIGSFEYEIRNRAVSGEPLAVEDSAGYFKDGEHMTFDGITSQASFSIGNSVDGKKVYNAVGSSEKRECVLGIQEHSELKHGIQPPEEALVSLARTSGRTSANTIICGWKQTTRAKAWILQEKVFMFRWKITTATASAAGQTR